MSRTAAHYLHLVKKQLTCPRSIKKEFLRQLESEVLCFCASHSDADVSMLFEQFGEPGEIAEDFLAELGNLTVNRCTRTSRQLLSLTLGILLASGIFLAAIDMQTDFLQNKLPKESLIASITFEAESCSSHSQHSVRYMVADGISEDAMSKDAVSEDAVPEQ
ncbi:MAG: hypothetical protein IJ468_00280 [Lachnospiraceae bacterium]|nr:hypothetical protein [Lachnospiraceae bacterium]